MRPPHKARPAAARMELQLGPLIDAVFLLLTYFVFTISLTTVEGLLPSELALGDDSEQREVNEEPSEVVIRVVQTGAQVQYFIDDWPVTGFERVRKHLASLPKSSMVIIDAGPNVIYEHVIMLYNDCLRLDLREVVFPISGGGDSRKAADRS